MGFVLDITKLKEEPTNSKQFAVLINKTSCYYSHDEKGYKRSRELFEDKSRMLFESEGDPVLELLFNEIKILTSLRANFEDTEETSECILLVMCLKKHRNILISMIEIHPIHTNLILRYIKQMFIIGSMQHQERKQQISNTY